MPKILLEKSNKYLDVKITPHSRAKRIILKVTNKGEIKVTVPKRTATKRIESFIKENESWIIKSLQKFTIKPTTEITERKKYLEAKAPLLRLIKERLSYYNQYYNYEFERISIRNQSTRWGSCSTNGTLCFNYRLLYLSQDLQDYVIVHELCHLREMNHSRKFWELVAQQIPDYKVLRNRLKQFEKELF